MTPLYSWLVVFVAAGSLTWYYYGCPNLLTQLFPQVTQHTPELETSTEKVKAKKHKPKRIFAGEQGGSGDGTSPPVSSTEGANNKKRKLATTSAKGSATGAHPQQQQQEKPRIAQNDDDSMSNKEFAKQFTQARSGSQLAPPSKPGQSKKERRANKTLASTQLNENGNITTSHMSTDTSSTNGADADDDLSPAGTPLLGATSRGVSRAGDVSDMLEATSSGPTVLRLTDPKGTMSNSQNKPAAKTFEVAETKKQRQARQKRESQKAANEEAEKERRKLMEKQIRGARIAEGTSAQSKTNSFKPPTENAWFANNNESQENIVKKAPAGYVEELDTREPKYEREPVGGSSISVKPLSDITNKPIQEQQLEAVKQRMGIGQAAALGASSRESGNKHIINGTGKEPTSSTQSNTTSWAEDMISEEETTKFIQEQQDELAWKPVATKKQKKKTSGGVGEMSGNDTTSEPTPQSTAKLTTKSTGVSGAIKRPIASGSIQRTDSSNMFANAFGDQQDSEWAP